MNINDVNQWIFKTQSKKIPDISAGDVVTVSERIVETKKVRIQKFQGIVISNKNQDLTKSILLRKKFQNFWLEKRFLLHSPTVEEVVIDTKGNPRRAVLNYLRESKHLAKKLKRLKK